MAIVPCHAKVVIPVKDNDERFIRIQEIIEAKQKMLFEKQKKLRFISRQNQFLEVVKDDYANIYGYVIQQKRDQIKALEVLDEYMKQLTIYGKLTKHNIEDAKQEQSIFDACGDKHAGVAKADEAAALCMLGEMGFNRNGAHFVGRTA